MDAVKSEAGFSSFLEAHASVSRIDLLIPDINGVIRGKRVDRSVLAKVFSKGVYLPGSVFGLNIQGETVEETGLGLKQGDPDRLCFSVDESLCIVPWQSQPTGQLLMTMHELNGEPFFADPRHRLLTIYEQFSELGLTPVTAVEMEFYLVDRERDGEKPQPPLSPATGKRESETQVYSIDNLDDYADFLADVIAAAREQGLPADSIIAEYAPGQFEVNLHHVGDPVLACDHAILLKRVIRNVALRHGVEATFMAKPYPDQAGCGMHVHMSLLDAQGNNAFAGTDDPVSQVLEQAIGGLLALMGDSMALLAPNVNSYRRFAPEFFTPCAPTWGFDNRSTAIRIPACDAANTRIEYRVSGADANPYLVVAAILAGMHYGLTEKITPPPVATGNASETHPRSLPDNLRDAMRQLECSDVLRHYFGDAFIEVYLAIRKQELETFEKVISGVEYEWFLGSV